MEGSRRQRTRLLAAPIERLRKTDGDRRLPLARGCGAHAGHEDEPPTRRPSLERSEPHLGHPFAVRLDVVRGQAEFRGDIPDGTQLDGTGDLDVALHVREYPRFRVTGVDVRDRGPTADFAR